jgi:hypothetical protein
MAKAYWEALLELNPEKLAVRIFDAETAILKRRHALQTSPDGHKEREAIEGALSGLRVLQPKRLDYPPGNNRIVDVPLSVFLGAVPASRLSKRFRSSGRQGHARFRHLLLHGGEHWIVRIPLSFSCLFFAVSHRGDRIRIEQKYWSI